MDDARVSEKGDPEAMARVGTPVPHAQFAPSWSAPAEEGAPPREKERARKPGKEKPTEKDDGNADDDQAEADGESDEEQGDDKPKESILKRHPWLVALTVVILIATIVAAILWYLHARHFEKTDDAFIDTRTIQISPQINGYIVAVPVNDNEVVEQGAILARLDQRDYQAAVDQGKAQKEQAMAQIAIYEAQAEAQKATIEQAENQVTEARAALAFAQDENVRYQDLVTRGAGTAQRAQQASSDLAQRQANVASTTAAREAAARQIPVLQANRRQAEGQRDLAQAQLERANADLERTLITAPVKGRVARLTSAVGNYANSGTSLLALVPIDVWVTANFKETQLADMRVGQPVTITVDAYPGREFAAHIDSIQAGSGTAFSLLPAENATGNYVKVVQRVPVKITFDRLPDVHLGPGMSVIPSVTVR